MNSNKLKNTKTDDNIEILKEIVNMRNQTLKDKPHIKKYYELREIHDIVRYLDLYNISKSLNNKIIMHSNLISKKKLTS